MQGHLSGRGNPPPIVADGNDDRPPLTFAALARLEPELARLEADVIAYGRAADMVDRLHQQLGRSAPARCANSAWYHSFKDRLVSLVGWGRMAVGDPALSTVEAYDLAYDHLYTLLPDCRGCGCLPAGYVTADGKAVSK